MINCMSVFRGCNRQAWGSIPRLIAFRFPAVLKQISGSTEKRQKSFPRPCFFGRRCKTTRVFVEDVLEDVVKRGTFLEDVGSDQNLEVIIYSFLFSTSSRKVLGFTDVFQDVFRTSPNVFQEFQHVKQRVKYSLARLPARPPVRPCVCSPVRSDARPPARLRARTLARSPARSSARPPACAPG